jgi:DNA-binding protein H-NS
MDLSILAAVELNQLKLEIDRELRRRHRESIKAARKQARKIADTHGLSVNDLVPPSAARRQDEPLAEPVSGCWRHPDDPRKVWRRRGRKPNWVKEWEASGRPVTQLLVA